MLQNFPLIFLDSLLKILREFLQFYKFLKKIIKLNREISEFSHYNFKKLDCHPTVHYSVH